MATSALNFSADAAAPGKLPGKFTATFQVLKKTKKTYLHLISITKNNTDKQKPNFH